MSQRLNLEQHAPWELRQVFLEGAAFSPLTTQRGKQAGTLQGQDENAKGLPGSFKVKS